MVDPIDIVVTSFETLVVLYVVISGIILMRHGSRMVVRALFLFGAISLLLSLFYWITYDFMYPDVRMPLAANEFGESAADLFFASTLYELFRKDPRDAKPAMAAAGIFAAVNIALWIGWSGEWLQDTLGGAVYGYMMMRCAQALKLSGALGRRGGGMTAAAAIAISALLTATFFVSPEMEEILSDIAYVIGLLMLAYYFYRSVRAAAGKAGARTQMALSFSGAILSLTVMYYSVGLWYTAANIMFSAFIMMMFHAVKEVTDDDIC